MIVFSLETILFRKVWTFGLAECDVKMNANIMKFNVTGFFRVPKFNRLSASTTSGDVLSICLKCKNP